MEDGRQKREGYPVPANFLSTGKVMGGLFYARGFFEGAVLGLVVLAAVFLSGLSYRVKVPLSAFLAGGAFLLVNAFREEGSAIGRRMAAVRYISMKKTALYPSGREGHTPSFLLDTGKDLMVRAFDTYRREEEDT